MTKATRHERHEWHEHHGHEVRSNCVRQHDSHRPKDEIEKLLAAAPKCGIEIRLPEH